RMVRRRKSRQRRIEVLSDARHEHDVGAFAGERLRARIADALARAGDDDDLVGELQIHGVTWRQSASRDWTSRWPPPLRSKPWFSPNRRCAPCILRSRASPLVGR